MVVNYNNNNIIYNISMYLCSGMTVTYTKDYYAV